MIRTHLAHRDGSAARRAAAAAFLSFAAAGSALADFSYANFSSLTGLTLVGGAAQSGTRVRLNPSVAGAVGGVWYATRESVVYGFDTTFQFDIGSLSGGGADGFAFVIQNAAGNALGASGCQMGYDPIANSIAVEFDTFGNDTCGAGDVGDPDGNHISIQTSGVLPNSAITDASLGLTTAVPNLSSGTVYTVRILYQDGQFSVFITDLVNPVLSVPVDLGTLLSLSGGTAWVGFTGAAGGAREWHDIVSWSFTETPPTGGGDRRPVTPTITEPLVDGQIVNAADVHMECAPFSDADGDDHLCSDWEIWTVNPAERVWVTSCIGGVERVHTHLGDGVFEGSHTGRLDLLPDTRYVLRMRHRSDSGQAATEWSFFGTRRFRTGPAAQTFALELSDIVPAPRPTWKTLVGADVILPGGATPAAARIDSAAGALLLEFRGLDGLSNTLMNPPALAEHVFARLVVSAGTAALSVPASKISFVDGTCATREVELPALDLAAGASAYFWIANHGATYHGGPSQTSPDFSSLASPARAPWAALQPGFAVDVFATGFQLPTNIAFAPSPGPNPDDPFLYVTELYGIIKCVRRDGTVTDFATNLLNFNPTGAFPGSGEQGVTGVVVDPISGDVFATMLYSSIPGQESAPHYPKVVRFTSTDGGRTAATQTTILDMAGESQGQSHQISNLSIGPDGKLYVHVGDGFDSSTALNLNSFRGKILRMNLDGSAPSDNPFYNIGDGISARDYVFAYGVRNPFGGAWRASDGQHYEVENGPSVDRFAKITRGTSYGWNGSDASMRINALYNWDPAHAPVNIAFVQLETFGGSGFPASKQDHAFVTESGPTWATGPQTLGKRIVEFVQAADGSVVSGPLTLVEYVGTGKATAVGLAAGPDGLYFSDLYKDADYLSPIDRGSNILRVRAIPIADCNNNGISDACDIAAGTAADADGDGIPDSCQTRLGDLNCDGAVNFDDIDPFVTALISQSAYETQYPECRYLNADCDMNGAVQFDDIDPFIVLLIGG